MTLILNYEVVGGQFNIEAMPNFQTNHQPHRHGKIELHYSNCMKNSA